MKTDHNINTTAAQCRICCIGHITLDRIVTPRFDTYMPGGTAFYFAKALENISLDGFRLVTAVGPSELGVVDTLRSEGIDVTALPSRRSVFFENRYGHDMNNRTQRVMAKADPFTVENLSQFEAGIFHLGTLLADDFSLDVIKSLAARGRVAVDVQGYLRAVVGQNVMAVDYGQKREAMPFISILKANEKEMEVLTSTTDPRQAARILAGWGCREVVLTLGDKGSLIYADGEFHDIPAYEPAELVDATGCGDTYMAGYLYQRSRGASIDRAGRFAAAMCSLKLAEKGPCNATSAEVDALIARHEQVNA